VHGPLSTSKACTGTDAAVFIIMWLMQLAGRSSNIDTYNCSIMELFLVRIEYPVDIRVVAATMQ
jgi:hypothetical protein